MYLTDSCSRDSQSSEELYCCNVNTPSCQRLRGFIHHLFESSLNLCVSCGQHSQNKVFTYSCLRGMTCMFGELFVVTKCFQAERYSTLRAPGVSAFQPEAKKSGVALSMQVHHFSIAKGSRYFQGRYGNKKDLPIAYVLKHKGSSDLPWTVRKQVRTGCANLWPGLSDSCLASKFDFVRRPGQTKMCGANYQA